jgi:hypothetical protein
MKNGTRRLLGIAGALLLLFGLLCLNYTKMGSVERHAQVAQQHNLPPPGRSIVYLGMLATPLGAALTGFVLGRKCSVSNS